MLGGALGSARGECGPARRRQLADVCVFDPAVRWSVVPAELQPGPAHAVRASTRALMELPGRVRHTLVAGQIHCTALPGPDRVCGGDALRGRFPPLTSRGALRGAWRIVRGRPPALRCSSSPFSSAPQQPGDARAAVLRWSARVPAPARRAPGARTPLTRRHADRRQPRVVARHHGDQFGRGGALRVQRPGASLAAVRPHRSGFRHAVHRARACPRRCARRAPDGRGAAGRRHAGRVPGARRRTGDALLPFHANLLQAAIATATPVQPIAQRPDPPSASGGVRWRTTMLQAIIGRGLRAGPGVHVDVLPAQTVDRRPAPARRAVARGDRGGYCSSRLACSRPPAAAWQCRRRPGSGVGRSSASTRRPAGFHWDVQTDDVGVRRSVKEY